MNAGERFAEFIGSFVPDDVYVAVLVKAYFDESGTHEGSPVMTMAGYVFRADQARLFSRDWGRYLDKKGLPYAHQSDCALGFGDYEGRDKADRVAIQKELITQIKRRSQLGLGVSVDPIYFNEKISPTVGKVIGAISPYSFCVLGCLVLIKRWADRIGFDGQVAFFFESGHQHSAEAHSIVDELARRPEAKEFRYYSHTFVDKASAPPLQAADMLAWQFRKFHKDKLDGKTEPRKDFRALIRPQDRSIDYTRASSDEFVRILSERFATKASATNA